MNKNNYTFKDELNVDGMLSAWIWYVFLMITITLFNDRLLGWSMTSLIFTNYRNKKLREAGLKL